VVLNSELLYGVNPTAIVLMVLWQLLLVGGKVNVSGGCRNYERGVHSASVYVDQQRGAV